MALLAQQYAAQAAAAAPAGIPEAAPAAGAELDVFARLSVSLDNATTEMRRQRQAARKAWNHCHPIPLNPLALGAAGQAIDERWSPRAQFAWQITLLSVVSGTATGWAFYRDTDASPGNFKNGVLSGLTAGFTAIWEPKGLFLMPGTFLVPAAFGGTAVFNGEAVEIALDWLPTYLM